MTNACDVRAVERELGDAFLMIAASWPFSGGSHLAFEVRQFINAPRLETNADKIEQQLSTQTGGKPVSPSSAMPAGTTAIYVRAPLACAVEIAKHMRKDFITHQLLTAYNHAWSDFYQRAAATTASWYANLYKAREILQLPFGKSDDATRAALRISRAECRIALGISSTTTGFLCLAQLTDNAPSISTEDSDELFFMMWRWIRSFLSTRHLPVVSSLREPRNRNANPLGRAKVLDQSIVPRGLKPDDPQKHSPGR